MWKNALFLIVVASMLVFSGPVMAGRDITGPGDIIQGLPNDGISQNGNHGWPGNEPPPQAIDDRIDTKYLHFKGEIEPTGFRVTPAVGPTLVTGLTFTTANDAVARDPIEYELWGSNVSIDGPYTLIASGPIEDFNQATAWPRRTKTETPIQFNNTVTYEHYQVIFPTVRDPGGANSMQIAEVELLAPVFKASEPVPSDRAVHQDTWANISWTPGESAVSHDVYFGDNFDDVDTGAEGAFLGNQPSPFFIVGFQGFAVPDGLILGQTYYWRVDEIDAAGTVYKGDLWSFTVPSKTAYNPNPRDTAKFIGLNPNLTWNPGWGAKLHYVYFGDNFDDVSNASGAAQQTTTTFTPGTLEMGKTYYWRVDEFDVIETHKGDIWSFTTTDGKGGIKGEYFNDIDVSGTPVLTRIDPQVDFNLTGATSPGLPVPGDGWSARWTADLEIVFADTFTFAVNCQDGTRLWIDDKLMINQWVTPTVTSKYYSLPIYLEKGIHSLRLEFFDSGGDAVEQLSWSTPTMAEEIIPTGPLQPPLRANSSSPLNGSVDVKQTTALAWNPGENAASHQVYFGTDADAVKNADTGSPEYKGTRALGDESFDPGPLEWNTPYYWRVDEINDTNPDSPWTGNVWTFTTANFLIVDDMESYNDLNEGEPGSNRIYLAWVDGLDDPANGSIVGYANPPFAEQTIVHTGNQSMPFEYDNTPGKSEATLTLTESRDWTVNGVDSLAVWYIGDAANAPATMYVTINGTATVDNADTGATQVGKWTEWRVSLQILADQGINLASINTITLGLRSGAGTGMIFFDDIRVHPPTP